MAGEKISFTFKALIYKIGINLVVDVPLKITNILTATRGYIPVKGEIENHPFEQTLCPVKNKEYLLYVNGLMLKGSGTKQGDTARFRIEQNEAKRSDETMPDRLTSRLETDGLMPAFKKLAPSRQKEIVRYLNYLKTDEARERNVDKVVAMLKG